jgi:exopolysaccharide biosynthesis polyprenyl glycosylphosphotransferase
MSEMMIGAPIQGPKETGAGGQTTEADDPVRAPANPVDHPSTTVHRIAPPVTADRVSGQRALAALLASDAIAVSVALVLAQLFGDAVSGRSLSGSVAAVVYLPVYLMALGCYGLYRRGRRRLVGTSFPDISHLVHSMVVASLVTFALAGEAHREGIAPTLNPLEAVTGGLLALLAITGARGVTRWLHARHSPVGTSRVLVVGSGVVAGQVMSRLKSLHTIKVVGWVDDNLFAEDSAEVMGASQLGSLDDLPHVISTWNVDHVVVAFSPAGGSTLAAILRDLSADVRISIVPRLFDLLSVRSHVDDLRGLPIIDVAPPALGPADRFAKRLMDLLGSGLGLLVLSPFLLAITLAIKLTSPGPVLFSQERTGRDGKEFRIHKFRTMRISAESEKSVLGNDVEGPLFKAHLDPRVTRIGRFLRQTSLDELPQLLNVFKGEMSLVGPRPFVPEESGEIQGWAAKRFDVRPGMTGLWQVSGRSDLPFDELCRLDYSYVASWSLWWDLHILWQTPSAVFRRHGAY